MSETQQEPLSPPLAQDGNLDDYSAVIQRNLENLFQLSHQHTIKTSAPASNEGEVGDIVLVESSGTFSIYAKFSSGWKSATLT